VNETRRYQYRDMLDDLPGWRAGDVIPALGYSRCYGCHRPWWYVEKVDSAEPVHHSVRISESSAAFALCERCWQRSTTNQRLEAYEWLIWQWQKSSTDYHKVWPAMEAEIRSAGDQP
jgi:hypothetical protein